MSVSQQLVYCTKPRHQTAQLRHFLRQNDACKTICFIKALQRNILRCGTALATLTCEQDKDCDYESFICIFRAGRAGDRAGGCTGIVAGDVITQVGQQAVNTPTEFLAAVERLRDSALILTERGFFIIKAN
jgi:hypothetical protein